MDKFDFYLSLIIDENIFLFVILVNVFYYNFVIWSGYYGSKIFNNLEVRFDGDIVYCIGSIIKIFLVFLIYKLFEFGVIDLVDDFLSKYVLNFDVKNFFIDDKIILR